MRLELNRSDSGNTLSRDELREAAQSHNTRIAYEKGWRYFLDWCKSYGVNPEKACADDVASFLIDLASENRESGREPLALNTLRLVRSALNYRLHRMELASPASEKIVDEVLQGLARVRGDTPRRVKAIREDQLLAMLNSCGNTCFGFRDAALLSIGFAAALRRSELAHLRIEDLEPRKAGTLYIHIRRSKTDTRGVGQRVAVLEGESITPITRLNRWLNVSCIESGFVFQTLLRGGVASGKPLDPGEVARVVKRRVKMIGLNENDYSGHSLRAGFVTSAAAHQARIDKIMEVTRHRSAEMVLRYIRDEEAFVDHAGASFL